MNIWIQITIIVLLNPIFGCTHRSESEIKDTTIAAKTNFRIHREQPGGVSNTEVDYIIEVLPGAQYSELAGMLITTANPGLIRKSSTSYSVAEKTCETLSYGKRDIAWTLPSVEIAEKLYKMDLGSVGSGEAPINIRGEFFTRIENVDDRTVSTWSSFIQRYRLESGTYRIYKLITGGKVSISKIEIAQFNLKRGGISSDSHTFTVNEHSYKFARRLVLLGNLSYSQQKQKIREFTADFDTLKPKLTNQHRKKFTRKKVVREFKEPLRFFCVSKL